MALSMQFSADDEAFREEVRDFLNTHLSPALRDAAARQTTVFPEREVALQWQRVLQEAKGWAAPAWPKAFGGRGSPRISATSLIKSAPGRALRVSFP